MVTRERAREGAIVVLSGLLGLSAGMVLLHQFNVKPLEKQLANSRIESVSVGNYSGENSQSNDVALTRADGSVDVLLYTPRKTHSTYLTNYGTNDVTVTPAWIRTDELKSREIGFVLNKNLEETTKISDKYSYIEARAKGETQ